MFLKVISWHYKGYKRLLKYLGNDKGKLHGEEAFTLFHNTPPSIEGAYQAFRENDKYRNKKIKGGVVLTHHILSFHPDSKEHISMDKLFEIATHYASEYEDSLVVIRPHISTDHVHLHCLVSHNKLMSARTNRVSKTELTRHKLKVQEWVLSRYPELEASEIKHGEKSKTKRKDIHKNRKEIQMVKRLGSEKLTDKHTIRNLVQTCFHTSDTYQGFLAQLAQNNIKTYLYRGCPRGVWYKGKKYTLVRSCQISSEQMIELQNRSKRMEVFRKNRDQQHDIEIDF